MSDIIDNIVIQDEEKRLVRGFATVEIVDRQNEIVPIEPFTQAMLKFMSRGGSILYGHENKIVGKVLHWDINDLQLEGKSIPGVKITAELYKDDIVADSVWNKIKSHSITGFSIGGARLESEWKENPLTKEKIRVLKELQLGEISLVEMPANQKAEITVTSVAKSVKNIMNKQGVMELSEDEDKEKEGVKLPKAEEKYIFVSSEKKSTDETTKEESYVDMDMLKAIMSLRKVKGSCLEKMLSKSEYPWSECMRDAEREYGNKETARKVCGAIRAHNKSMAKANYLEDRYSVEESDYILRELLGHGGRDNKNDFYLMSMKPCSDCGGPTTFKRDMSAIVCIKSGNIVKKSILTKCPKCGNKLNMHGEVAKCPECGFHKNIETFINKLKLYNTAIVMSKSKKVTKEDEEDDEEDDDEEDNSSAAAKASDKDEEADEDEEVEEAREEYKALREVKVLKSKVANVEKMLAELLEMSKANYKDRAVSREGEMPKATGGRKGDGLEGVGIDSEIVEIPDTKKSASVTIVKSNSALAGNDVEAMPNSDDESSISKILGGKTSAVTVDRELRKQRNTYKGVFS